MGLSYYTRNKSINNGMARGNYRMNKNSVVFGDGLMEVLGGLVKEGGGDGDGDARRFLV